MASISGRHIGIAAISLTSLGLFYCGGKTIEHSDGVTGGVQNQSTGGQGGSGGGQTSTGGSVIATGGSTPSGGGSVIGGGGSGGGGLTGGGGSVGVGAGAGSWCAPPTNTDANCTNSLAKTGAACTQDCCIACGYLQMGTKYCTCQGGVYSSCPCPRPAAYLGAPTAPYCNTADGTTPPLKGTPCTIEWEECIGRDVVTGTTPQGCVCLPSPMTQMLTWTCGSTQKWFSLQ